MARQRFYLPNSRGRLFQPVPSSAAPPLPPHWVPDLITSGLDKRLLPQRRGRMIAFRVRTPEPARRIIITQPYPRRRLLPTARGRIVNRVFVPVARSGPLVGQTLRPRVQPLRYQQRNRLINWVIPNQVIPPGFQAVPLQIVRSSERLLMRPARGRIFDARLVGATVLTPPPPLLFTQRRAPLIPRRSGHIFNRIFPGAMAGPGPVAIVIVRQAGTSSHTLRIRRGTVVMPPWPAITPPPPVPPVNPGQGTDDDVGSSLGRRKWHWQHRAVKSTLPKSLVWEHR